MNRKKSKANIRRRIHRLEVRTTARGATDTAAKKQLVANLEGTGNMLRSHEKELAQIRKIVSRLTPVIRKLEDPELVAEALATFLKMNGFLNEIHLPLSLALDTIKKSEAVEFPSWKR